MCNKISYRSLKFSFPQRDSFESNINYIDGKGKFSELSGKGY